MVLFLQTLPKLIIFHRNIWQLNLWKLDFQIIKEFIQRINYYTLISKKVYTHLMRHCSFTHLCEAGTDINLIQKLAGHNNVKTTMIYTYFG
ncbi:MAG: tyrosine-type recombinase/integrase [Saprospiraceae bacterium]|nr:tyrosine-type recombinase/integrase [Saprospiraceae bacterium]